MKNLKLYSIINNRRITYFVILFTILIISIILSILLGSSKINIIDAITNPNTNNGIILYKIRLPRIIAAIFAGIGLSLSGYILQHLMHNDLVSPNTIGISSGSGLMVVLILSLLPNLFSILPIFSFFGAFLTTLLIYFLSSKCGGGKHTIILAGIAISSLFQALMKLLFVFYPDTLISSNDFLIGTFANISFNDIYVSIIIIIITTIILFIYSDRLKLLSLGDEMASSLGLNVKKYRLLFIIIASLLASSVISYAGLISFVGLIIPHISKKLINKNIKLELLSTILLSSILVLLSDTFTRFIFSPYEIPCGIVISIFGVPFFIYLLLRRKQND